MPRLIAPGNADAIGIDELVDTLDATSFDARDEDGFAALGPLLAQLGRNRTFLADAAIEALKAMEEPRAPAPRASYGPQVLLLRPPNGRYVLRANFWPARDDAVVRASGTAAFFYDMPHDHNFPLLTYGYAGPGYWSDYYEYSVGDLIGVPGEVAGLRFTGRRRLEPGTLMLYRMRRDVHVQLPPDAFSVSLNILGADPAQPWLDQYRFDTGRDIIAGALTSTAAEALVSAAVHFGGNGIDLAHALARDHPCDRMRVTATSALASAAPDAEAAQRVFESAANSPRAYVAGHARSRLAQLCMLDDRARILDPHWMG